MIASVLVVPATAANAEPVCFIDPSGDTFSDTEVASSGEVSGQAVDPAAAADILEFCVDTAEGTMTLGARMAEPTDPAQDWYEHVDRYLDFHVYTTTGHYVVTLTSFSQGSYRAEVLRLGEGSSTSTCGQNDGIAGAYVNSFPTVSGITPTCFDQETFADIDVSAHMAYKSDPSDASSPVYFDSAFAGGDGGGGGGTDLESAPCVPTQVHDNGLTNIGFETGNLDGWTQGHVADEIAVTGADNFTSPWEGSSMLRLGAARASSDDAQPPGPNTICQDFVVTQATQHFAYNLFTYDYTGFDAFRFDVTVLDEQGAVIAELEQGSWGEGTALKTSGWQGVTLDLSGRVGQTVRLKLAAGGTSDSQYGFWAYVDSAANSLPEPVTPVAGVESSTGSVMLDPQTGQITIGMPTGNISDVTIVTEVSCPEGKQLSTNPGPQLLLGGQSFVMTPVDGSATQWRATISSSEVVSGTLTTSVVCDDQNIVTPIGSIQLYDPSGLVTDAVTAAPIVGASVHLYKVPGWTPKTPDNPDGDCQTNESKGDGPWNQPAPTDLGQLVSAYSKEIHPNVNPFITNSIGYYGWDVAYGCWYVVVTASGYESLTSPVVGVPSEVTDLDLALTPVKSGGDGGGGGGSTTERTATNATADKPLAVAVTSPNGGAITMDVRETSTTAPSGFKLLAREVAITAPAASVDSPLRIEFRLHDSLLPEGISAQDVRVFRDGQAVSACEPNTGSSAVPDPCVAAVETRGDEIVITVRTSRASVWSFGVAAAAPPAACAAGVPEASFRDVSATNVHRRSIDCVVWREIARGTTATTYGPAQDVTRAQMATFLVNALAEAGVTLPAGSDHFRDDNGNLHESAINKLAEARLVLGTSSTSYSPSASVSRAQMASFLVRAYEHVTSGTIAASDAGFNDIARNVHRTNINKAANAGLAAGRSATTFAPAEDVRRDQMASFIRNTLEALAAEGHVNDRA